MGFTVALMGLFFAIHTRFMEFWLKRYFVIVFSVAIAYTLSDFTSQISLVFLSEKFWILSKVAVFCESFFSSLLMPMLTVYMLHLVGDNLKSAIFYRIMGLWGFYFITLVITQFTDSIYTISDKNIYSRGPFYPILLVSPVLLMLTNIIYLNTIKDRITRIDIISLRLYILIPLGAMIIQMFFYGILVVVLGTSVAIMFMFISILHTQIEKNIDQAIKISEQKLTIRMLQMSPHFIYNTLSNIYYLCDIDPGKAKTLVGDFTTYLRKNFYAIEKQELISFEEELVHTKAFLAVVMARYEGQIFVEYDTDYISFQIPPLTLEPIVENSVKHGFDPDADALHIIVRTEHQSGHTRIIVEDDGSGYSPDSISDTASGGIASTGTVGREGHIGLSNVRDRLKSMCGGELMISERDGGGTIVTITVPD